VSNRLKVWDTLDTPRKSQEYLELNPCQPLIDIYEVDNGRTSRRSSREAETVVPEAKPII
jgi:hypothetical protein